MSDTIRRKARLLPIIHTRSRVCDSDVDSGVGSDAGVGGVRDCESTCIAPSKRNVLKNLSLNRLMEVMLSNHFTCLESLVITYTITCSRHRHLGVDHLLNLLGIDGTVVTNGESDYSNKSWKRCGRSWWRWIRYKEVPGTHPIIIVEVNGDRSILKVIHSRWCYRCRGRPTIKIVSIVTGCLILQEVNKEGRGRDTFDPCDMYTVGYLYVGNQTR